MHARGAQSDIRALQREIISRMLHRYFHALQEEQNVEDFLRRLKLEIEVALESLQRAKSKSPA
jgi:hypothetical protein